MPRFRSPAGVFAAHVRFEVSEASGRRRLLPLQALPAAHRQRLRRFRAHGARVASHRQRRGVGWHLGPPGRGWSKSFCFECGGHLFAAKPRRPQHGQRADGSARRRSGNPADGPSVHRLRRELGDDPRRRAAALPRARAGRRAAIRVAPRHDLKPLLDSTGWSTRTPISGCAKVRRPWSTGRGGRGLADPDRRPQQGVESEAVASPARTRGCSRRRKAAQLGCGVRCRGRGGSAGARRRPRRGGGRRDGARLLSRGVPRDDQVAAFLAQIGVARESQSPW